MTLARFFASFGGPKGEKISKEGTQGKIFKEMIITSQKKGNFLFPYGIFIHPLVPKGMSDQSVTLAKVSPAKVTLAKLSHHPKCVAKFFIELQISDFHVPVDAGCALDQNLPNKYNDNIFQVQLWLEMIKVYESNNKQKRQNTKDDK